VVREAQPLRPKDEKLRKWLYEEAYNLAQPLRPKDEKLRKWLYEEAYNLINPPWGIEKLRSSH